jgi:hypothetical protein
MLWAIIAILVALWLVGLVGGVGGSFITKSRGAPDFRTRC